MEPEDIKELRLQIAHRIADRDIAAGFYAKIDAAIGQLELEKKSQYESILALMGTDRAKEAKIAEQSRTIKNLNDALREITDALESQVTVSELLEADCSRLRRELDDERGVIR